MYTFLAKVIILWLRDQNIDILSPRPGNSPDFYLIENLSSILKRVTALFEQCQSSDVVFPNHCITLTLFENIFLNKIKRDIEVFEPVMQRKKQKLSANHYNHYIMNWYTSKDAEFVLVVLM